MGKINPKASAFQAPAWASFFLAGQWADFNRLVTAYLAGKGLSWKEDDGVAVIRRGGGPAQRVGLLNLAQRCHLAPLAEWPTHIAEFFDSSLKIGGEIEHMVAGLSDFAQVRDRIKIRLHPEDYMKHPQVEHLMLRKIADGISALLVCDLGVANISVPREFARSWSKPEDELFSLGLANVRKSEKVSLTRLPKVDGYSVDSLASGSNYTAAHLLCLEDYCSPTGYGAVVAVPNRHILFLHRIQDDHVTKAIGALHSMALAAHRDGPGSISPDVYWWRKDHPLQRLEVHRRPDRIEFIAGIEFQREVLVPMMRGN